MSNPTFRDLNKIRREIKSLLALGRKQHLGGAKQSELESLIRSYKAMHNHLEKRKQELDNAELSEIRASKRAQTEGERRKNLDEVNRIRRERRKLFGEV